MRHLFIYEGAFYETPEIPASDSGYFKAGATRRDLHCTQDDYTKRKFGVRVNLGMPHIYSDGLSKQEVILGEDLIVGDYMYVFLGSQDSIYKNIMAGCQNIIDGWEFEADSVPAEKVADILYCQDLSADEISAALAALTPVNDLVLPFASRYGVGMEISGLELKNCAYKNIPDGEGGYGLNPADLRGDGRSGQTYAHGHYVPNYYAGIGQGLYLRIKVVARPEVLESGCGKDCGGQYPIIRAKFVWEIGLGANVVEEICSNCQVSCRSICKENRCKLDLCDEDDTTTEEPTTEEPVVQKKTTRKKTTKKKSV